MTHPHLLRLRAAARSLEDALTVLEARAREVVEDALAGSRAGDVSIPSQVFGRRHALGGHGDPTAVQALGAWAPGNPNPYAALLGDMMRELDRLASHLPGAPGMDPLTRIRQAPHRPHVGARLVDALQHLDGQVRRRLSLPPALQPVEGDCPACRTRALYVQTAGPEAERTVICRAGCLCSGEGCPCGMPVRAAGVPHIWEADPNACDNPAHPRRLPSGWCPVCHDDGADRPVVAPYTAHPATTDVHLPDTGAA